MMDALKLAAEIAGWVTTWIIMLACLFFMIGFIPVMMKWATMEAYDFAVWLFGVSL